MNTSVVKFSENRNLNSPPGIIYNDNELDRGYIRSKYHQINCPKILLYQFILKTTQLKSLPF